MSRTGRPLRFLGLVVGGWVVLRLGAAAVPLLWEPNSQQIARSDVPSRPMSQPSPMVPPTVPSTVPPLPDFAAAAPTPSRIAAPLPAAAYPSLSVASNPSPSVAGASLPATAVAPQEASVPSAREAVRAAPPLPTSTGGDASRWSLTGWLLWRPNVGRSFAQAPLLGGSQGGVRLDYRLWQRGGRSLSVYGRVTRALERPFAEEAALGLSLRPLAAVSVSFLAERRQRIGAGGRSGFALLAAGGIGPRPVAPRIEVEGYAQAGIVGLPGSDAFADGRLSFDYRLTAKPDLALGIAISGAAQTGASRLDVGPALRLRLPVATGHLRVTAQWQQRLAGDARPASGPTLALVADF